MRAPYFAKGVAKEPALIKRNEFALEANSGTFYALGSFQ